MKQIPSCERVNNSVEQCFIHQYDGNPGGEERSMASQQVQQMPASLQLFAGTIAGLVATMPVTIFILIMHRIWSAR